jgi:hypothetical protein
MQVTFEIAHGPSAICTAALAALKHHVVVAKAGAEACTSGPRTPIQQGIPASSFSELFNQAALEVAPPMANAGPVAPHRGAWLSYQVLRALPDRLA